MDNEQELLSDERVIPVPAYGDSIDITAHLKAQVAKLKAVGYEQVWKKCPGCIDGVCSSGSKNPTTNYHCRTCKGTGRIPKYVKWDREKVARYLAEIKELDWEWKSTRLDCARKADQLKEILGGEE